MEQTFRPIPAPAEPNEPIVKSGGGDSVPSAVNVEVPLSQYQTVNQTPYTAKFFELEDYNFLTDLTDVNDTRLNVKTIEEYVYHQISTKELYDTTAVYADLLNELFERMGLDKNERMDSRLAKTAKYIELMSRSKTTQERRKELIRRQKDTEERVNGLKNKLFKINETLKDLT
jgi:hypothetical protein